MNIAQFTQAIEQAVYNANMSAIQNTLNNIYQENDINDLRTQLDTLPSDIHNQRRKINSYRSQQRNLHKDIKEKESALKSLENDLLLFITAEINPDTGKPKFSNDKARQAELNNRKKTDTSYIAIDSQLRQMRDQADELENQVAMAEAELERCQNTFTAVTKKVNLVNQEMSLITAVMAAGGQAKCNFGALNFQPTNNNHANHDALNAADGWDA